MWKPWGIAGRKVFDDLERGETEARLHYVSPNVYLCPCSRISRFLMTLHNRNCNRVSFSHPYLLSLGHTRNDDQ